MKLSRDKISIRHSVTFARPSPVLAAQGAHLLDGLMEELATAYNVTSKDVALRSGTSLDEWSLSMSLFNRLGTVVVTVDGIESNYNGLKTDNDLAIVIEVQRRVLAAVAARVPTLKTAGETIGGSVIYSVEGGKTERDKYFARVTFPGLSSMHVDVAFKARMRLPEHDLIAALDVTPVWADETKVLMNFDADTSKLSEADLRARAELVNRLVTNAMLSFDLEHAVEESQ